MIRYAVVAPNYILSRSVIDSQSYGQYYLKCHHPIFSSRAYQLMMSICHLMYDVQIIFRCITQGTHTRVPKVP